MTNAPNYIARNAVPGNPPQTLPRRRVATEQDQYRPLKQLSERSETPAAVPA